MAKTNRTPPGPPSQNMINDKKSTCKKNSPRVEKLSINQCRNDTPKRQMKPTPKNVSSYDPK